MLDENNLFQRAATSAYASMAAFTAAANMYNSFYPTTNSNTDPVNYFGCAGKLGDALLSCLGAVQRWHVLWQL